MGGKSVCVKNYAFGGLSKMRDLRVRVCRLAISVILLLLSAPLGGFASSSEINGRVLDPSGAVIVQAQVTATNVATNIKRTTTTNEQGIYRFLHLPPGEYNLRVSHAGFRTTDLLGIVVHVTQTVEVNVSLRLGSVVQTVTVDGGRVFLGNQGAEVGTVVDRQFVQNLPLNGRSFQTLIMLTPGVVLIPADRVSPGQFSVNGQRSNANNFIIDGVSGNFGSPGELLGQQTAGTTPAFTVGGGTNNLVSIDALEEFRIQTSTYSAEFGRQPGAQVSVRTRSGTSQFHGTLFEYFRNDKLDATEWFANRANLSKAPLRQNDFGGVLGGPIVRDKTFFFVSYEGLRLRQPQSRLLRVPTLAFRQITPPSVRPLVDAFPVPNGPDVTADLAEHTAVWSNPSSLDAYSVKLDQHWKKARIFGRYNYAPSDATPRPASFRATPTTSDSHTLTIGSTAEITPFLVNETRANWSRNQVFRTEHHVAIDGAIPPPDSVFFPSFASSETGLSRILILGGVGSLLTGKRADTEQRQLNIVNTLSYVRGKHHLKVGGDYRRLRPTYGIAPFNSFQTFRRLSSLLTETGFSGSVSAQDSGFVYHFSNWSFFGQDTWLVTPRLTLTYGLRWEYNPPPSEKNGRLPFTVQGLDDPATMTLAPAGTPLWNPSLNNFAPRVGVALNLSPDHGIVLRGGYGIYYDMGTGSALIGGNGFPYVRSRSTRRLTWPLNDAALTPPDFTTDPPVATILAFDPNLRLPYSEQWNVAVEKSLGPNQTISVTYLGQKSHRLLGMETLRGPNPDFDVVRIERGRAASKYRALQVQFQRRMSRGLQALASYSWSRSTDNSSTDGLPAEFFQVQTLAFDWGLSSFDVKHVFTSGFHYEIPAPSDQGWARGVFGNWSFQGILRAQSGTPLTVTTTIFDFTTFLSRTVRPDIVPGEPLWIPDSTVPNGRRLNINAFAEPLSGQGNHKRNSIRQFGYWQADTAINRDFVLTEGLRLQLGFEAFNVFNHPNFGEISSALDVPSFFGTPFGTLATSLGGGGVLAGLSPVYQIGGTRSIQINLKLKF